VPSPLLLNYADLRSAAKRRLPRGLFEFIDRGTEDERALRSNQDALTALKFIPRVLRDVSQASAATTLFGSEYSAPVIVAPTGAAGLAWHRGELALAKAAAATDVPFILSTASLTPLEEIMEHANGKAWFQLYLWPDKAASFELVERTRRAGFQTLVVTVDTVVTPNREYNVRNGFSIPIRPTFTNAVDAFLHPRWTFGVMFRYLMTTGLPRHENYPEHLRGSLVSKPNSHSPTAAYATVTWGDLQRLRDVWPGRLLVKGILHPEDAKRAVGAGMDGIIISNHGGRNLDSAISPILQLPRIREAVGSKATVLVDSGFQRGGDVVKALALGADAVLLGRMPLWGAAANGKAGAVQALQIIRTEIVRTLSFLGVSSIEQLHSELVTAV
jgi:isopentenyl diphosphate isomerase/L-lactate dehydrogenase-like FMN-dependent dehydrogenase